MTEVETQFNENVEVLTKKLIPSDFVHLHNHTHYSILDGLQKIKEMVPRVKELGMEAVAITDHGSLAGSMELYKVAKDYEIKPIIGTEMYVANRLHTDKDPMIDRQRFHLIMLAMNDIGVKNLFKLSSIAAVDGLYFKPRIDRKLIEEYNEGIIVLSGCIGGELGSAVRENNLAEAEKIALWYKGIFGDRYYIELQDHAHMWDDQKVVNERLIELANRLNIPMVVTADAHYLHHSDQDVHEVLLCVQTASNLDDPKRFSLKSTDLYLTDPLDVIKRWQHMPEVILNTKVIADRCNISFTFGNILIPKFVTGSHETEKEMLHRLTWQGLAWRYGGISSESAAKMTIDEAREKLETKIIERAEYELRVIDDMGFNGYFLIVQDFINWGKNQGIIFGPGRGSAAGSIVSFAIRITELDPIAYDLLFERFLNPDRISMPDIDIDIQDSRRGEVIEYCVEKYGRDHVSNIGTYGVMAAKAAVRDAARVMGMPYAEADKLAKLVPAPLQGRHIPLKKSLVENLQLKEAYEESEENKRILDIAARLDGTIRNVGVHAAGVIIAPGPVTDYLPLYTAPSGVVASQFTMSYVEDLGLLKMDFLGLSNLTTINNACRIIKKTRGAEIDIATIPLDDKPTFELLSRGDTTGVFQLESGGMRKYLKRLKPNSLDDIIAMCALYRPGPLAAGLVDKFIDRKLGLEPVVYDHPKFEVAYKDTYGVLVYQEQFMIFSREICGFSGGQSDTLRKGVGKKKKEVLDKLGPDYIEGGIKVSGIPREIMEKSWNDLLGFADYCFNKSHSACYGLIAYQTAYLKANYPEEFMSALMSTDFNNMDRLSLDIADCKKMGIEVLSPDVNESFAAFGVPRPGVIRFGLEAIKNVGKGPAEFIVEERKKGKYTTIEDLLKRTEGHGLNKKVLEALIKCGALDSFGFSRSLLLHNIEKLTGYNSKPKSKLNENQGGLFGSIKELESTLQPIVFMEPEEVVSKIQELSWERELLGLFLSAHPLDDYRDWLKQNTREVKSLSPKSDDGKTMIVGGTITNYRKIMTKNGQPMAFITIEDLSGTMEVIAFPKIYEKSAEFLDDSSVVIYAKGLLSYKGKDGSLEDEPKLLADEIGMVEKANTLAKVDPLAHQKRKEMIARLSANKPKSNKKIEDSPISTANKSERSSEPSVANAPNFAMKQDIASENKDKRPIGTSTINHDDENHIESSKKEKIKSANIYINIDESLDYKPNILKLKSLAELNPGELNLILVFGNGDSKRALKMPFRIAQTKFEQVTALFGSDKVIFK